MNAALKNKISPPAPVSTRKTLKPANSKISGQGAGQNPVDFKELLMRSNRETAQRREAEANGDLSQAKNYQDFLNTLNKKSQQEGLPRNSLDKHDFLNLFITQIQNQDPLNPKDGTEMASQLAQFNSLEQMMNMNTSLDKLGEKTDEGHNIQFVDYIGKEVAVGNGKVRLDGDQLSKAEFKSHLPINRTTLSVRDSLGNVVATKDLGPRAAGTHQLSWDGTDANGEKVPNGIYTVSLLGEGKAGSEIDLPVSTRLKITGIDLQDKGSSFYTNLGKISYADISEIGEQGFKPATIRPAAKTPQEKTLNPQKNQSTAERNLDPSGLPITKNKTLPKKEEVSKHRPDPLAQSPLEMTAPFKGIEAYKKQIANNDDKNDPQDKKL